VTATSGDAHVRTAHFRAEKPQLVHYFFRTMDVLFVEVFRRRADENLDRAETTRSCIARTVAHVDPPTEV
jgi:hypothetical protein